MEKKQHSAINKFVFLKFCESHEKCILHATPRDGNVIIKDYNTLHLKTTWTERKSHLTSNIVHLAHSQKLDETDTDWHLPMNRCVSPYTFTHKNEPNIFPSFFTQKTSLFPEETGRYLICIIPDEMQDFLWLSEYWGRGCLRETRPQSTKKIRDAADTSAGAAHKDVISRASTNPDD